MNMRKRKHPAKSPGKRRSNGRAGNGFKAPRTAEQYFAKPAHFKELWNRITHVIARMRSEKVSLQQASKELGVDPRTVVKRGGTALQKSATGRYQAKKSDRLLRVLVVPVHDGLREIAVRGSRNAAQVGGYWSAVQKYLQTGNASGLKKFRDKKVQNANGEEIPFIADPVVLNRLAARGKGRFSLNGDQRVRAKSELIR
jgi:hypothetical protein